MSYRYCVMVSVMTDKPLYGIIADDSKCHGVYPGADHGDKAFNERINDLARHVGTPKTADGWIALATSNLSFIASEGTHPASTYSEALNAVNKRLGL